MRSHLWRKTTIATLLSVVGVLLFQREDRTVELPEVSARMSAEELPHSVQGLEGDSLAPYFRGVDYTIRKLMRQEHLRGGCAICISRGGRVVYTRGIGYADKDQKAVMEPTYLMRVASVSKLITAIATMHLVEEGRLSLDQKVFGPDGILGPELFNPGRDLRHRNITVRNLLNHSGGWIPEPRADPMFSSVDMAAEMRKKLPLDIDDIIRYMLRRQLGFNPGAYSYYSNFGYGVLGEVVEMAAGMPYEDYVRSRVLAPLGIYDARLGYSHPEDRFAGEATYYGPDDLERTPDYAQARKLVRRAYGGSDIHTLGSAGGWIISAADLLKLTLSVDGLPTVTDQLTPWSIALMTDPQSRYDPLGWRKVIEGAWFRTGTLSASSAIICRRPDNICFAAVFNCANWLGPSLAVKTANELNRAISHVRRWPDCDLLADDQSWQAYQAMTPDKTSLKPPPPAKRHKKKAGKPVNPLIWKQKGKGTVVSR